MAASLGRWGGCRITAASLSLPKSVRVGWPLSSTARAAGALSTHVQHLTGGPAYPSSTPGAPADPRTAVSVQLGDRAAGSAVKQLARSSGGRSQPQHALPSALRSTLPTLQPWPASRATADGAPGIRPQWSRDASHSARTVAIDDDAAAREAPTVAGFALSTGAAEALADDDGTKVSWKPCPPLTPGTFFGAVGELCKVRLSGLVVSSAVVGYAMAPGDMVMSLDNALCFNGMMIGTALCVFSANSFNQWLEVPFDAQMKRTCNRPLVRGAIRPVHALGMACAFGVTGTATLLAFTNPLTALLGFGNIALYAGVYTSMKRTSIANTWWGSIVGAIPPMMGWTAVTGTADPGAWLLGATLFFWQFPHFNALSWNLRGDYSRAGYRMMSVVDPGMCKRVALQYSAAMIPLAIAFPYFDLCSWWVAIDGSILNAFLTYRAWQFHEEGSEQSARRLFFDTLWHLPAIMLLYWLHKKREGNGPWYPFSWGDAAKAEGAVTAATAAGSA